MDFNIAEGISITNPTLSLVFLVLLMLISMKYPEKILALFAVGSYFLFGGIKLSPSLGPLNHHVANYAVIFLILGLIWQISRRKILLKRRLFWNGLSICYLIYILFSFLSWAIVKNYPLNNGRWYLWTRLMSEFLPFWGLLLVASDRNLFLSHIKTVTIILVSITVLNGIQIGLAIKSEISTDNLRYLTTFNKDFYLYGSSFIGIVLALFAFANYDKTHRLNHRFIGLFVMFLAYLAVLVGQTRIFVFSAIIVPLYVLIRKRSFQSKNGVAIVAIFAILLAFILKEILWPSLAYPTIISNRVDEIGTRFIRSFQNASSDPNIIGRFESWRYAWESFRESPIIGVGLSNAGMPMVFYDQTGTKPILARSDVHNVYLRDLAELGLIGFLPFVAFLVLLFRLMRQNSKCICLKSPYSGLSVFANAVVILSLISGLSGQSYTLFWAAALVMVIHEWAKRDEVWAGQSQPSLMVQARTSFGSAPTKAKQLNPVR